jgi:hypothetical protein
MEDLPTNPTFIFQSSIGDEIHKQKTRLAAGLIVVPKEGLEPSRPYSH